MSWSKFTNPNGIYYSPFSRSKSSLSYYKDTEKMVETLNNKEGIHYEIHSPNLVECYEKSTAHLEPINLPSGIYSHAHGNQSYPERLTPFEMRDDGYIELIVTSLEC